MPRAVAVLTVALVLVVFGSSQAPAWPPDRGAVDDYIATRSGSVSYAVVGPRGHLFAYRGRREVPSASVIKVMFMTAYLRHFARGRALDDDDRALLGPMIKRSDNSAATRVANMLGPRPINRLARKAHMRHFHYTRPWGMSRVTATEQARFMYALDGYIPDRHDGYARYLLSHVIPSQRWGIGRTHHPNWRYFFKGGWGSGTGWVDHQVAFIERGATRIGLAVMITSSPSHSYGKQTLYGVFDRLMRDLPKG
ncbi:MAG TPA: serine hydrolase [Actinomycetota bacterium]|nr:serine hydrolase [Actinomycetota bacterium]